MTFFHGGSLAGGWIEAPEGFQQGVMIQEAQQ